MNLENLLGFHRGFQLGERPLINDKFLDAINCLKSRWTSSRRKLTH